MKYYKITENNITYDIYQDNYGTKFWYKNGKLHRDDGPAIEYASGTKSWYNNEYLHRTDGPAIEGADGHKQYWYNNKYLEFVHSDIELKRYIKLLSIF